MPPPHNVHLLTCMPASLGDTQYILNISGFSFLFIIMGRPFSQKWCLGAKIRVSSIGFPELNCCLLSGPTNASISKHKFFVGKLYFTMIRNDILLIGLYPLHTSTTDLEESGSPLKLPGAGMAPLAACRESLHPIPRLRNLRTQKKLCILVGSLGFW